MVIGGKRIKILSKKIALKGGQTSDTQSNFRTDIQYNSQIDRISRCIHFVTSTRNNLKHERALLFFQPLRASLFVQKVRITPFEVLHIHRFTLSFSSNCLRAGDEVESVTERGGLSHRGEHGLSLLGESYVFLQTPKKSSGK